MKTIFKKAIASITMIAMVAGLLVGINATKTEVKAADGITLTPWNFYEGAASFRSGEDPWAQRFYNSVTTSEGESLTNWGSPDAGTEEKTIVATKVANGFTADILTTGWDGDYTVTPTGNNPYLLRAYMTGIQAITGHDYTISFTAEWTKSNDNGSEKNIMVGVMNSYGESVFKDTADAVTQIKVPSGSSVQYTQNFTLWAGETLDVTLAYGAFMKDTNDGITTEGTSAAGILKITDLKIIDNGKNPDAPDVPDKPTVPSTQDPTGNNNNPTGGQNVTPTTPSTPAPVVTAKKLAKVKKLKAKNTKKGTVKITWKKVAKAKTYQVKVGKKTYTSKKVKLTVKKLKKGKKYTIKVRAKAAGYKAGAWAKTKVKIKK